MGIPFVHPNESQPRLAALSTNDLNQECCTILDRIPGAGLKGAGYPENVLGPKDSKSVWLHSLPPGCF